MNQRTEGLSHQRFDIKTEVEGTRITTTIDNVFDNIVQSTMRKSFDTQDAQVREALIKLGWTPPKETT